MKRASRTLPVIPVPDETMAQDWRAFERQVAGFFGRAGFQVELNPKAARPRQTDVFAHDDELKILIEVKARKRPIDVGDVAALRSRLNLMRPAVVGAIFSTSRLTSGARQAIESDRTREIVTFTEHEIDLLRHGQQNLRALIEQKRDALTVQGKVWEASERRRRYLNVPLPTGNVSFRLGRSPAPFFETRALRSGGTYALEIHDTGWGHSGEGARLAVRVALHDADDLRDLMGYLQKMFGFSTNGMFFIQQTESCWHGLGAQEFIDAVQNWRVRYAASPAKRFHHSEEVGYYDSFDTGWIHVSAHQRVDPEDAEQSAFIHLAEITVQLPGLPVDAMRFRNLCRYVNNDWAHFEVLTKRWTQMCRLKIKRKLSVVGKVLKSDIGPQGHNRDRSVVIGVVAKNPFYRRSALPKELSHPDMLSFAALQSTELLLCSVRDWHDDASEADAYYLEGVEVTEGGSGPILRPLGTWNHMRGRHRGSHGKDRT